MDKLTKGLLLTMVCALTACSEDEAYSERDRTEALFIEQVGGDFSPAQWWMTSVALKVNVRTEAPVTLYLMSDNSKGVLFDYREVPESGLYTLTAPQGKGFDLYLVTVCNQVKTVHTLTLTGKTEETLTIDTTNPDTRTRVYQTSAEQTYILTRATGSTNDGNPYDPEVHKSLHTNSFVGGSFHYEFDSPQKRDMAQLLEMMGKNLDAKYGLGLNCDYELESKGPFNITWLAGYEADQKEHYLGYYVHSPGTYEDMEFHDLAETHKHDIIDGLAKVQYQISDATYQAHPETGILPNKWYDANYDMEDIFGSASACNPVRVGDKAYNSIEIFKKFGSGISRVRGLTFMIDVPAGKRVGFYLKANAESAPEQWEQLNKLGIKGIDQRTTWKAINFCAESFNKKQTHRSCIVPYDNSIWMGMEDIYDGGDFDCNDVMFGITVDMAIYRPEIVVPDINILVDTKDKMPWTLAFEDVARNTDFDFNDAVIKLVPDYEKEVCCVTVEAAGSTSKMYLHYDGPDGDINLGEIHELLGGNAEKSINTAVPTPQNSFVQVDCVPWPKWYSMAEDAKRFRIEIQRGTCDDCTDTISLPTEPGKMPEALLVAGEWKWPMEGVHICTAYSTFPYWAKDVTKISYWGWYDNAKSGTVVSY